MKKEAKELNEKKDARKCISLKSTLNLSNESMQKNDIAVALYYIFIFALSLWILPSFAFADGRTNEPSHQTLFSNVITSYTDANAVTIADAQGLYVTGSVGIGNTLPSAKLHIGSNDAGNVIRVDGTGGKSIQVDGGSTAINSVGNPLALQVDGSQKMRIMGDGNVGIGTATPAQKLHVAGIAQLDNDLYVDGSAFDIAATANPARKLAIVLNSYDVFLRAWGASGQHNLNLAAGNTVGLKVQTDGDVEFMSGNVGIGTANPNDGKVEVKGGTVCVDTNSDDSATSCIAAESDIRLKKNITPIINALEKIQKINGVTFDWRWDEYEQIQRFKAKPHGMGVIAQEVEDVFPEAMNEEIGSFKSVDKEALVAPLIEAVKELKAETEALNSKIEKLEQEYQDLLYLFNNANN